MDKRILRERMRRKKRQLFIRKIIRLGACAVAVILVLVFLVKGIITPLVTKIGGGSSKTVEVQAQTRSQDQEKQSDSRFEVKTTEERLGYILSVGRKMKLENGIKTPTELTTPME